MSNLTDLKIPADLLPRDGRFGAGPSKVRAAQLDALLVDGTTYPQRGHIAFADASFNSETGTYLIRAEMPNTKGMLRPGQFVRVRLIGAVRTRAITVPQEAVVQGQRGQSVWLVGKDNKAESRVIDVGE